MIVKNKLLVSLYGNRVFFVPRASAIGAPGSSVYKVLGKKHEIDASASELANALLAVATREGLRCTIRFTEPRAKRKPRRKT